MLRTNPLRTAAAIILVLAVATGVYSFALWRGYAGGSATHGSGAPETSVPSAIAAGSGAVPAAASSGSTLATFGLPQGYAPFSACQQISFARSSDGASARWTYACKGGPMTQEAWREGLRRATVDLGWREVDSRSEILEFVKDDLGVAMTIDPRPADGAAFALTQRVLRS